MHGRHIRIHLGKKVLFNKKKKTSRPPPALRETGLGRATGDQERVRPGGGVGRMAANVV